MSDGDQTVTLDRFLASLVGGDVHSSGAFTISEQDAQSKLGRYTLIHPSLYVLELMGVAVLGKATYFQVSTPGAATHFFFGGLPLTSEDCRHSLNQTFEISRSPRLSCLGLGLKTAQSQAGQPLTLVLEDGTFSFDGDELHRTIPSIPYLRTEIRVPGRFGFLSSLFRRDATLKETLELCALAPLRLSLDEDSLSSGWRPYCYGKAGALFHWEHPDLPLSWGGQEIKPHLRAPSPGNFSAMLALVPHDPPRKDALTIVHQGVCYRQDHPSLDLPGLCALVMSENLKRNLSCSEILWDDAYQDLIHHLRQAFELLIEGFLSSPHCMKPLMRGCKASLEWAAGPFCKSSEIQQRARSWLSTLALLDDNTSPQVLSEMASQETSEQTAGYLRLLGIELSLEKLKEPGKTRQLVTNLGPWTSLLQQLNVEDNDRRQAITDFLAVADPCTISTESSLNLRILQHRIAMDPGSALALAADWTPLPQDRELLVPVELCLALGDTDSALHLLLQVLECATPGHAVSRRWNGPALLKLDLLADILEYRKDPMALRLRQERFERSYGPEMIYLSCRELSRYCRAKGQFAQWVRYRARSSYVSVDMKLSGPVESLYYDQRRVARILDGREAVPEDIDSFLLPLRDHLQGQSRDELFAFLAGRLVHRLRLAGELLLADKISARVYSLRSMEAQLESL